MANAIWNGQDVQLVAHPKARNKAIARRKFRPGEVVFSDIALAIALLPGLKGKRCDACFRWSDTLKRCSGCIEYWYCGSDCQTHHWKSVHRHMCKNISEFLARIRQYGLPVPQCTDAFLLNHLVAEHGHELSYREDLATGSLNDPLGAFLSLLPRSSHQQDEPFVCRMRTVETLSVTTLQTLRDRFDNNNFVVHSHLNPVGHGIFPFASRLFNHSCVPSAINTYVFRAEGIMMEVKALTEVTAGDEITIPYFDPALPFRRRQEISRFTYGFECDCRNCLFHMDLDGPSTAMDPMHNRTLADMLLKHAFPHGQLSRPSNQLMFTLPLELKDILHDDFLPTLSEEFTDSAHDGHYDIALRSGVILLALYLVLYPPLFPQTGMHCLELAKTAWNASVAGVIVDGKVGAELAGIARQFLALAVDSISVLGKEGDDNDEPSIELTVLEKLLTSY